MAEQEHIVFAESTAYDGEFTDHLVANWSLLVSVSRKLASDVIDSDDLLSAALLATLQQWRTSRGSITNLNAYIIGTMRNRVTDELRSPRSRVANLDDGDETAAEPDPALARADLLAEVQLLREAMLHLPEEQRTVLEAMFYRDQQAADLTIKLGRSRPAVSMLAKRARENLKRTMLQLLLTRNSVDHPCRTAAERLPKIVSDAPPLSGETTGHYEECGPCRDVWSQFGTFAAAASLGSLVVLGGVISGGATPAAAAAGSAVAGAAGAAAGAAGIVTALDAVPKPKIWPYLAAAASGGGIAAAGALLLVAPQQLTEANSELAVTVAESGGHSAYEVSFDSEVSGWEAREVEIQGARQALGISAPVGWLCEVDAEGVSCVAEPGLGDFGEFVVEYGGQATPSYTVRVRAAAPGGSEIIGTAVPDRVETGDGKL